MTPKHAESEPVPGRFAQRRSLLLGRGGNKLDGKEFGVSTPLFMRNAEGYAGSRKPSGQLARLGMALLAALIRHGADGNRRLKLRNTVGPGITPKSPQSRRSSLR
jgi:hypothetical protein